MDPLHFDPNDPLVIENPYPHFQRLRTQAPVYPATLEVDGRRVEIAVLSRFADCAAVLHDARFTAEKDLRSIVGLPPHEAADDQNPVVAVLRGIMLFRDPPDHTRIRSLVNRAFTPRRVETLRPRIRAMVDEILDRAARDGAMDLIHELAAPLPVRVIAELIGVPGEDHAQLKAWSDQAAALLDGGLRTQHRERATRSLAELAGYLAAAIAKRKRAPREDLISALVRAQEADDRLTDAEVLATCVLILGAGHETTTNLIGNGTQALLDHPDELAKLRANPRLIGPAVEELLRFDSPVQATSRIPTQDVEIGGYRVEAGCEVNALLGAANRDPQQFEDPERLRIDRADCRHLAFGRGAHFCLGAGLARLEGQIAIGALVSRFAALAPAGEPKRRAGFVLRGFEALPLRLA